MPKERDIVLKIKEYMLKRYDAPCVKYPSSVYGEVGVPDLWCVLPHLKGRLCCLEVKRPKKGVIKPKQLWWIYHLKSKGAIAGIVESIEDVELLISRG